MEQYYSCGEFARLVGVSKNTLVHWERRGWLLPHHVSPSGRRFYSEKQVGDYYSNKVSKKALGR